MQFDFELELNCRRNISDPICHSGDIACQALPKLLMSAYMLFAHLSTRFQAVFSDFKIRLLQIRPNLKRTVLIV